MSTELMSCFVGMPSDVSEHDHWIGGTSLQEDLDCECCGLPLLLIWNLNAQDPRFVTEGRPIFEGFDRIPFYFCWRCGCALAYELFDDGIAVIEDVHLVGPKEFQGSDFPYADFPLAFTRQALSLCPSDQIDAKIKVAINQLAEDESRSHLTPDEQSLISGWLGREVVDAMDLWWHQLGGEPSLYQGLDARPCPNEKCEAHAQGHPMKILAAIKNDPLGGLPMLETAAQVKASNGYFNAWVQLAYYFCDTCFTIRVTQDGT